MTQQIYSLFVGGPLHGETLPDRVCDPYLIPLTKRPTVSGGSLPTGLPQRDMYTYRNAGSVQMGWLLGWNVRIYVMAGCNFPDEVALEKATNLLELVIPGA